MTPQEIIEVVSAFERGEKIERRYHGDTNWYVDTKPEWCFDRCDYRVVKPNPKKVKLYGFVRKTTSHVHLYPHTSVDTKYFYRAPHLDCEVDDE